MLRQLVRQISSSQLPGDDELSPAKLREIADVLLDAADLKAGEANLVELTSKNDSSRVTRIAIVGEDMPFLVDSVAAVIAAKGLAIDCLVHPVVPVVRDTAGKLIAITLPGDDAAVLESMIYIETKRIAARERRELSRALDVTLGDVRAAVSDWQRMAKVMADDTEHVTDPEGKALLSWLYGGMLTQLGHITRHRNGRHSQAMGICHKSTKDVLADATYERAFAWFDAWGADASAHAPLIIKANRISNVHRRVPLDLFIVPRIKNGEITALSVHAGIWTSNALNTPPGEVPRMRQQFATLTQRLGFDPAGHTGKALLHALTALPHDLLIGLDDEDVCRVAAMMSSLADRPRPRMTFVEAPLARHLFVFVWLPRDLVSTQTRLSIQGLLETEAEAETLDWSLRVEEGALALLRFVLDIRESQAVPCEARLDQQLQVMLRGWSEAVEKALAEHEEPSRAAALAERYAEAFPMGYRLEYGAVEAARDIARIKLLTSSGSDADASPRDARLYHLDGDEPGQLRLKIYQIGGHLPLSDAVPALENFGFRVQAEIPTILDEGRLGTIHDFRLESATSEPVAHLQDRAREIETALVAVLNNRSENDLFNRLVVTVRLDAEEANWLRALFRYLRQAGLSFTMHTVVSAFSAAPRVARALIDLFRARLDPDVMDHTAFADAAREAIHAGLGAVAAINDDRLLRLHHSLIEAIVRTNAFALAGNEALAFKIDSSRVPGLPKPLPWREIFVYSQRVEGIHLRSGPVARGGLRWSDRRDDYRAEILGLMKAQRVKNAVIVPTGAKGGFYPKLLPDPARDRDAWASEGQESYEIFIRSLLSVTDNILAGQVRHPQGVFATDGDDPYFVVAADKGTARFSDVANAIAEQQGFWLGDAFASGGSNGYDHKAMGITARGAWISVQRHFMEMGLDIQKAPVRVVGCGDMSGDVFGNGMLLSKAIKLVAAFDHRHIFIDPDPDPATAWKERKRLYELPRSSWADYDPNLISRGGGVWPRSLKTIPISVRMRDVLGIAETELDPDTLISAILAAPADLLWFGGIGTYVKSALEQNSQVRDPANDALRIDATQLRVKVIGEGANLGITQAGRIEFALAGGRINTDFIDNSAGVDCSDNEVNIKIALAAAHKAGRLSLARRNALLQDMTEQVAQLVLEDNRLQALALSVAEHGGTRAAAAQVRLIQTLEDTGVLDRSVEGLADEATLTRRAIEGMGLTRPELAILHSNTKLVLQGAIEASALPDDPGLIDLLYSSFPDAMQTRYRRFIDAHRLRREIISTKLANRIINRLGMVHPFELAEETSANLAQICGAYLTADWLFDLEALWRRIETRKMDETARLLALDRLAGAVRNHTADVIRISGTSMVPSELYRRLQKNVAVLEQKARGLLRSEGRKRFDSLHAQLSEQGVPTTEIDAIIHLYELDGVVGLANLSVESGIASTDLAAAFVDLSERVGLDRAQGMAALMTPSDPWERLLVSGLARDMQQIQLDFLHRITCNEGAEASPQEAVERWAELHADKVDRFRTMIARAWSKTLVTSTMLAHISSQARNLFAS